MLNSNYVTRSQPPVASVYTVVRRQKRHREWNDCKPKTWNVISATRCYHLLELHQAGIGKTLVSFLNPLPSFNAQFLMCCNIAKDRKWSEPPYKTSWKKTAGPRNSYYQAGISRQPSAAPVYQKCNENPLRSFKGQGQTILPPRVFLFIEMWMQMLLGLSVSLFLDWGHFNFHKRIQMIRSNLSHT